MSKVKDPLDHARAQAILQAMRDTNCVRTEAAKRLNRSISWLYGELRRLNLGPAIRKLEREAQRETWAPGRPKRKQR